MGDDIAVGIDLGTSYSAVATVAEKRKSMELKNEVPAVDTTVLCNTTVPRLCSSAMPVSGARGRKPFQRLPVLVAGQETVETVSRWPPRSHPTEAGC